MDGRGPLPTGVLRQGASCENPLVTTRQLEERLAVSRPTALRFLRQFAERGVLSEAEPGPRGQQRYVARQLMAALASDD